jgi:protein-tyrosine-phosphatase
LNNTTQLNVSSVGFHSQENRPADSVMVQIAAENGIDLSNWSSQCVTKDAVDKADVILVMEIEHFHRLISLYPTCKHKTYLLSSVSADNRLPLEIADPFEQSSEVYTQCFHHINIATKAIADLIK